MEVTTKLKSIYHACTVRHMRENAQLELSIVCNDELVAWFGDERFANMVYIFVAGGLILEVRPTAGDSSRLRVEIHAAVDSATFVRLLLQRIDIGREQFFDTLEL